MKRPFKSSDFAHRGMKIQILSAVLVLPGVLSGHWKDKYFRIKMRCLLSFTVTCLFFTTVTQAKTSSKKHKVYFKLVEAYTQRTLPGIPGGTPQTNTHFIIVWDAPKSPETFFWRGEGGWLTCSVVKAHKATGKPGNMIMGADYMKESVSMDNIHKGDTLELTPVAAGKSPAPADIPETTKNTLFFKSGGSGWLAFPVKNISKKQDIAMP